MDAQAQGSFDALFDTFLFALLAFILFIVFFPTYDALLNAVSNSILGSNDIAQQGTIVLILSLFGLIFVALVLALLVKTALGRRRPFEDSGSRRFGGI